MILYAYHEKYEGKRVGVPLIFVFDTGLSLVVRVTHGRGSEGETCEWSG